MRAENIELCIPCAANTFNLGINDAAGEITRFFDIIQEVYSFCQVGIFLKT